MTAVAEGSLDLLKGDTIDPDAIAAAGALPGEADAPLSVMDQIAAKKAARRSKAAELRCPIPCWDGELVGTFTLLTKAEEKALADAQAAHPPGMKKEDQQIRYVALIVAFHCRKLELNGEQVDGAVRVSGFTAEFGESIGAQAPGGGDPSLPDIVFEAVDRRDKSLGALVKVLTNWTLNPSTKDLEGTDPFGL